MQKSDVSNSNFLTFDNFQFFSCLFQSKISPIGESEIYEIKTIAFQPMIVQQYFCRFTKQTCLFYIVAKLFIPWEEINLYNFFRKSEENSTFSYIKVFIHNFCQIDGKNAILMNCIKFSSIQRKITICAKFFIPSSAHCAVLRKNKKITAPHTVWKLRKFSLTHFWQKFRENNGFTK